MKVFILLVVLLSTHMCLDVPNHHRPRSLNLVVVIVIRALVVCRDSFVVVDLLDAQRLLVDEVDVGAVRSIESLLSGVPCGLCVLDDIWRG